jgi:hypothetical protein
LARNNLFPHCERIIAILHPDLNGFFGMAKSQADTDLGTMLERGTNQKPGRLVWADGTAIESAWRPTTQHEPKPVRRRGRVMREA